VVARSRADRASRYAPKGEATVEARDARRRLVCVADVLRTPHALSERAAARPSLENNIVPVDLLTPKRDLACAAENEEGVSSTRGKN